MTPEPTLLDWATTLAGVAAATLPFIALIFWPDRR